MVRVVPDTNIWVASIQWRGRPYRIRKLGEEGTVDLVTSLPILAELTRVLREYFGMPDDETYEWYQRIGVCSEIVHPTRRLNVVPDDPDDDKFVECAIEGHADYIISRDGDLLRLKQYERVRIVDDDGFLRVVQEH